MTIVAPINGASSRIAVEKASPPPASLRVRESYSERERENSTEPSAESGDQSSFAMFEAGNCSPPGSVISNRPVTAYPAVR